MLKQPKRLHFIELCAVNEKKLYTHFRTETESEQ